MGSSPNKRKATAPKKHNREDPSGGHKSDAGAPYSTAEEVRVFLSYARQDETSFGMVRPFKDLLRTLVHAKSGLKISTFLDQDDIRWGEIWRERLDNELLQSSVFIPILSANYLDSSNCRMEFNKFYTAAVEMGVTDLVLPVMLMDAPAIFNESSSDDLVRAAVGRQYEVIEDAVLSDPGSSAWKATMARLADRFTESYQSAEAALAELQRVEVGRDAVEKGEDGEDEDQPGIADLLESLEGDIQKMTTDAEAISKNIEALGAAAESVGTPPENASIGDIQRWSFRAANALSGPSKELSIRGEQLLSSTRRVDTIVVKMKGIAAEIPAYRKPLADMLASLDGMQKVQQELEGLLTAMKPAESLSAALRRALRPATSGLTRVTDSLAIIQTWV